MERALLDRRQVLSGNPGLRNVRSAHVAPPRADIAPPQLGLLGDESFSKKKTKARRPLDPKLRQRFV